MILEPKFEQALEGTLAEAEWQKLLADDALRHALCEHICVDALLRVALEEPEVGHALEDAIAASVQTADSSDLEARIWASTVAAQPRVPVHRFVRPSVMPWLAAAAVVLIAGVFAIMPWPASSERPGNYPLVHVSAVPPVPVAAPHEMDVTVPKHVPVKAVVPEAAPAPVAAPASVVVEVPSAPSPAPVPMPELVAKEAPAPEPVETPAAPVQMAKLELSMSEPPRPATATIDEAQMPKPVSVAAKSIVDMPSLASVPADNEPVDFERHILPVLERSCYKCHSAKLKKPKGDVVLDDASAIRERSRTDSLIFPHKPDKSTLLASISRAADDEKLMPPPGEGDPLSAVEVGMFRRWIDEGASFGNWTSVRAKTVTVSTTTELINPADPESIARRIDELIQAGLAAHGEASGKPANDATFLRRAYLDLAGRIPTSLEARTFLGSKNAGRRREVIDQLLASEGHVSHMFNVWTGLLRARDDLAKDVPGGYYLDWIKQSIRENKPYDQWAREMLSPEGFGWRAPATGYYLRDGENRAANVEATASLFLGTQLACAQCHDHPFDQWTRKDYHQFSAWTSGIVASNEEGALGSVDPAEVDRIADRYARMSARPNGSYDRQQKYARLSDKIESLRNAAGGNGVVNGESKTAVLPEDYQYNDGKPGQALDPGVPFGQVPDLTGARGADVFAQWVTSPENPRFTLTIANRLWAQLFGWPFAGPVDQIRDVADCDNPDLAKYLENVVKTCRYDLRAVLRILCLTQAYQAVAVLPPEDARQPFRFAGPAVRRLSAEQVWDSMMALAVEDLDKHSTRRTPDTVGMEAATRAKTSGQVIKIARGMVNQDDLRMKAEMRKTRKFGELAVEFSGGGFARASELPQPAPQGHFLRMFGQGNRDFMADSWSAPTVPQALLMLNSDFFDHVARSGSPLANSLRGITSPSEVIRAMFLAVLTREPTQNEIKACLDTIGETRNPKLLAKTLLTTAEFVFQK